MAHQTGAGVTHRPRRACVQLEGPDEAETGKAGPGKSARGGAAAHRVRVERDDPDRDEVDPAGRRRRVTAAPCALAACCMPAMHHA